jgi:hypothetical protein
VPAGAVGRFHEDRAHSLSIAGEAEVPLTSGILARFVVFRDSIGESSVAVIIGAFDLSLPTPLCVCTPPTSQATHSRQKAICCRSFTPALPEDPAASMRIISSALTGGCCGFA